MSMREEVLKLEKDAHRYRKMRELAFLSGEVSSEREFDDQIDKAIAELAVEQNDGKQFF